MNTIRINGVTITAGRSITVNGNRVFVDGKDVTPAQGGPRTGS